MDGSSAAPGPVPAAATQARAANDSAPNFTVNVYAPPGTSVQKGAFKPDGQGGGSFDVFIKQAVTSAILDDTAKNGPITQAISGKQRAFGGQ